MYFHLNQLKYVRDLLHKAHMADAKTSPTPMCYSNKMHRNDSALFDHPSIYRSTISAFQYLTLTRPYVAFSTNQLSQFLQHPTIAQWKACKRILRYVKGTLDYGLFFKPAQPFTFEGFCDFDWANNFDDCKSVSGFSLLLGGNLISWISHKQKVVACSSTEAEYRALASAITNMDSKFVE